MSLSEARLLLGIPAYFALLGLSGAALLRRLDLPGQTWLTLAPLGLLVGLSLQMVLANAVCHLLAPPAAFPVAWALQAALPLVLRGRPRRAPRPLPPARLALGAGLGLLVLLGFGSQACVEFQFDNFKQHWLNVATILEGNFPVRHAFQPDASVRYHYGAYLLSAQVRWLSGAPFYVSPQPVKTAFAASFLMLVFGWVAERRGRVGLALLALCTVGAYVALPEALAELAAADSPGDWLARAASHARQNEYFHFPSAALFVLPVACGFAIALAALHLLWRRELRLDAASGALLVVLMAALALAATPEFALVFAGLGLFVGLGELRLLARPERSARRRLLLCLALALAIACVQGGILTDLLFLRSGDVAPEYALRWPPGMAQVGTWEVVHRVGSRAWLAELVLGPDLLVLLVPVVAFAAVRRYTPARGLALAWIGVGLLLSHFLEYTPAPFNTNRFLAFALELCLVLLFLLAAEAGAAGRLRGWTRVAAVAGAVLALLGSLPGLAYPIRLLAGRAPDDAPSYLAWWDDPQLLAAAAWIRSVTPRGAMVASNEPALLVASTGRFSPSSAVVTHGHARPGGLPDDYSTWTADALLASGAHTVCLFRSPLFQAGDVDVAALERDLARPGPEHDLLRRLLARQLELLQRGSPETAAAALNWVIRWRHRLPLRVDPAAIELPAQTRARLAALRDAPAAWMYVNRAILQALLPEGTAASRQRSERIDDAHLARYAWPAELARRRGPLAWRSPPFAPERLRCAVLPPA